MLCFLMARDQEASATFTADYLMVDNVYGKVPSSCVSGASVATSAQQNFRYKYSRVSTMVGPATRQRMGRPKPPSVAPHQDDALATGREFIVMTSQTEEALTFSSTENVLQHWAVGVQDI